MTKRTQKQATPATPVIPQAKPTRGAQADRVLAMITMQAAWDVEYAQKDLDKFVEKLKTNPASAFEWSASEFNAAARFNVAHEVQEMVKGIAEHADEYIGADGFVIARRMHEWFLDKVLREARSPSRSTSVQSNEMERCLGAARATWIEKLDSAFHRYEF